MVIEGDGHEDHTDMTQETNFADWCKAVSSLEGNHFDEDIWRLYNFSVSVLSTGASATVTSTKPIRMGGQIRRT